jgi:hypothetical protein
VGAVVCVYVDQCVMLAKLIDVGVAISKITRWVDGIFE